MPQYLIRRNVPGATPEEIDASAFRALVCAQEFEGLQWVESHWDRDGGVIFCLYEARSAGDLVEHARRARIPCDQVFPVQTIRPADYVETARGVTPEQITHA